MIVELYTKANELVDTLELDAAHVPHVGDTLFFEGDHDYFDPRESLSVTSVSYRLDATSGTMVPIVIAHGTRP
ncbi:MAG: hypothetical protein QGI68_06320 [Pseudomonadales bacterium]|nr:hypothetical protein [Pseudomonadales bacterium]MDP7359211.1 hypothetical protein [Pseudomonadales bacterium]MDP7595168.1 hypothetical protein [Pseudomonadales bacterium]HJN50189.1 hypothetical protein [Pseudomonadales bacterium]